MMSGRLEFDFEWRITLVTVLLLPLLISLGFWQLRRAGEKEALAAAFAARLQQPPAPLESLSGRSPGELGFRPVSLTGHYREDETFLLENQVADGRYGNDVLTVFELDGGLQALVNRGWTVADPARLQPTHIPPLPPAAGSITITGRVYVPPGKPFLLGEQEFGQGWPKPLQAIEMDRIATVLRGPLFPYTVRIDPGEAGALRAQWQVVNISPARHRGYAVQWFGMAAALFLLYLLRSTNLWQLIKGARGRGASQE